MAIEVAPPTNLAEAADAFQEIGLRLATHNAAALVPMTEVAPAAGDPVSGATAARFSAHAQMYYAFCAEAAAALDMVTRILGASAGLDRPAKAADSGEPASRGHHG